MTYPVCFLSLISRSGGEATQRTATPCTSVRFRPPSPFEEDIFMGSFLIGLYIVGICLAVLAGYAVVTDKFFEED